jgi:serine/threonine protein phosphatase PrpC
MTLQLHIATHSEIGPVRKNNQDSGYASPNLLVVADGMGGAAAGDLASAVAIDTIRAVDLPPTADQMLTVLAGAVHEANDRIADLVEADYALEGMGTTVTGVLFDGAEFGLAHIGDSRAYLMHDGRLERLTHDHSWVQSLVDDGKISEGEAAVHPHRSLLLKVLNGQPTNDPDLTIVKVVEGDRLLLCSDGLCGLVDDPLIEEAMRLPSIDDALRRLVDEALAEGGIDNITVILADVVESDPTTGAVVLGAAAELKIPAVEGRLHPSTLTHGGETPLDTAEQPAAGDGSAEASSSGADATSATGAAVTEVGAGADGPGADDEERYLPQPPRKRRLGRPLVGLLALLLIVGAGLGSAYAWTRTQYYVGAANEHVAIYRGLSDGIPGLPLSTVFEEQTLAVSALPPYYQERVRANIDVMGLSAARQTVTQLADAAKRCALAATPQASTSPKPSTSPRVSAPSSARPSVAVTTTPAAAPSTPATVPPSPGVSTTPGVRPSAPASVSPRVGASPSTSTAPLPETSC